jgi:hypothetical protein
VSNGDAKNPSQLSSVLPVLSATELCLHCVLLLRWLWLQASSMVCRQDTNIFRQ